MTNLQFENYTRGTAFLLSMTHDHCTLLQTIGEVTGKYNWSDWKAKSGRNIFVPCVHGLIRRGLVVHNPFAKTGTDPLITPTWIYRLTEEGKLVLQLLYAANVIQKLEIVNESA